MAAEPGRPTQLGAPGSGPVEVYPVSNGTRRSSRVALRLRFNAHTGASLSGSLPSNLKPQSVALQGEEADGDKSTPRRVDGICDQRSCDARSRRGSGRYSPVGARRRARATAQVDDPT